MTRPRALVRTPGAALDRVVDVAGMRRLESATAPEIDLMQRAGSALAVAVHGRIGPLRGRVIVALVGPGDNGGDALIMARALARTGASVICWASRARSDDPLVDATRAAGVRWRVWSDDAKPLARDIRTAVCVVDGLLGIGSAPPLRGHVAAMLRALPEVSGQLRLAIDVPSGVDGDTGQADANAFRATGTLATGPIKLGTVLHPGIDSAGAVEALDIGLGPEIAASRAAQIIDAATVRNLAPARPLDGHKGAFGRVLIVGGSAAYRGAPALAALAAQGAGAGVVTVASVESAVGACAAVAPAATFRVLPANADGCIGASLDAIQALGEPTALLVGPGLSRSESSDALALDLAADAQRGVPTVIDADGLNALADEPARLGSLGPNTILTPHPGEMRRLLDLAETPRGADMMHATRELAALTGAVVIGKGSPTFVAAGDRVFLLARPNPALAAAGSGDVLAGAVAALAAQGLAPIDAARLGVWLHARAGELAGYQQVAGVPVEHVARHLAVALAEAPSETFA
ncbi:MAG: NAD(P)H-hydrate dehydratase [Chloroflexota bacterium]|nr:NAD(P)H-hydrate dehydratase [Chloroflexota bacterium]